MLDHQRTASKNTVSYCVLFSSLQEQTPFPAFVLPVMKRAVLMAGKTEARQGALTGEHFSYPSKR